MSASRFCRSGINLRDCSSLLSRLGWLLQYFGCAGCAYQFSGLRRRHSVAQSTVVCLRRWFNYDKYHYYTVKLCATAKHWFARSDLSCLRPAVECDGLAMPLRDGAV